MAVDIRFYRSLLGVYLFFIARIQAASDGSNTPDENMAGWREGPNSRGTLNIVWSCCITIFACTWTVTHLNLPGPNDTALQKFIRRFKWMSINIMFPEFILSKAICDLRQALDELRQFGQTLPNIRDRTTWTVRFGNLRFSKSQSHQLVDRRRSWEVEYPPCYKLLYGLLGLEAPKPSDIESGDSDRSGLLQQGSQAQHGDPSSSTSGVANAQPTGSIEMQDLSRPNDNDSNAKSLVPGGPPSQHQADSPTGELFVENAPQKWTISHSYYAQMGGIMIPSKYTSVVRYKVLTATKLTPQYQWDEDHPLKRLELSEQDIQDKSKADWLLKSLAILQIVWLVLNVIVRGVTGLAVTQLEIATAAFALMAVLTYVASWWKPKDISEPTYTRRSSAGEWKSTPQMVQLSLWFKSPATAANSEVSKRLHSGERVPNDVAWMGGRTSLMTSFLAVSSLLFGGIHCFAWNFGFPSRTELILWRSACVVAAILPTITLGVSSLLSHLSAKRFNTKRQRILVQAFNGLPMRSSAWWNALLDPHVDGLDRHHFHSRSVPAVANAWQKRISPSKAGVSDNPEENSFGWFLYSFIKIRKSYEKALQQHELDRADLEAWLLGCTKFKETWGSLDQTQDDWYQIEAEISRSHHSSTVNPEERSYTDRLLSVIDSAQKRLVDLAPLDNRVSKTSKFLSITSYMVYSVARLLIMVQLFTSLRSTPADVYEVTQWVNLLPKIS